ncbi:MAG: DUF1456 family protein [Bacteroidota bacterium]
MGLTNNDILKKLRVAHKLRTEDMVEIIGLAGMKVNKGQLNDLFRKETHPSYVDCGDQILRNFLNGLIIHLRGPMPEKKQVNSLPKDPPKVIKKKILRRPK